MKTLLATAFGLALLLPPFIVGACAWLWHAKLAHPWWFVAMGLALLYATSTYLMTRQFSNIGITGQPSSERSRIDEAMRKEAVFSLLLFLAVAASGLGLLGLLLSR